MCCYVGYFGAAISAQWLWYLQRSSCRGVRSDWSTHRPGDSDRVDAATEVSDQENENLVQSIVEKITPDSRYTRVEFIATIILAVAAVLTAWTALQSAKWSGDQATKFSQAGQPNRVDAVR